MFPSFPTPQFWNSLGRICGGKNLPFLQAILQVQVGSEAGPPSTIVQTVNCLSTPSQGRKWGFKPCTLLAQLSNYMWGYFTSEEEAFFFESREVAISSLNGVCVYYRTANSQRSALIDLDHTG